VARFTIAINRRFKREGDPDADFISCIAFGKVATFAEKYLIQGMKVEVNGRIQTGSYTNRDGVKVYTTDVVAETLDFGESKAAADQSRSQAPVLQPQMTPKQARETGQFMAIPDDVEDIGLPFN